ncbi:hypothetical protein FACS189474_0370 [Bacteroidia bacterium]|nr:hypothetical protein FACS189474_0370 [Bacteroidia bacterium]
MKILKRILRKFLVFISIYRYKFLNFYILNLTKIWSKKCNVKSIPSCQQKTYVTGRGIVEIGEKCSFGYKLGGFWRGGSIELQPRYENANIRLGNNIATNNNIFVCAANYIEVGNDVLIGQNVCIMDFEAHGTNPAKRRNIGEIGKVIIGNNRANAS